MSLLEESRPLLDYLYAHASKTEFSCRVQWREGSVGLWDNRATCTWCSTTPPATAGSCAG